MSAFDDMNDPELRQACNRLAAYCESLPAGAPIDAASGLGERDLVLILRRLHWTRHAVAIEHLTMEEAGRRYGTHATP